MTNSKYYSKAIIRTGIGSQRPLHPQCQHVGDFTNEVAKMCPNINVVKIDNPKKIFTEYKKAIDANNNKSTILVEYGDYYNEK